MNEHRFSIFCFECLKESTYKWSAKFVRTLIGESLFTKLFCRHYMVWFRLVSEKEEYTHVEVITKWGIGHTAFSMHESLAHFYYNHPATREYDVYVINWKLCTLEDGHYLQLSKDMRKRVIKKEALKLQKIWGDKGIENNEA